MLLKTAFGSAKYASLFDTEEDLRYSKRYFGEWILKNSEHELKQKVDAAVRRMDFPDIAKILEIELEEWETRCHKPFTPAGPMLEDKTTKERKLQERKDALAQLRKETGL